MRTTSSSAECSLCNYPYNAKNRTGTQIEGMTLHIRIVQQALFHMFARHRKEFKVLAWLPKLMLTVGMWLKTLFFILVHILFVILLLPITISVAIYDEL